MSEEYKMSEPLTNHNTVFVKNIEQENKDAQYREEFKKEFGHDSSNDFCFYLAGRKAGQEELDSYARIYRNDLQRWKDEIDPLDKKVESLKKELDTTKTNNINFMALSNSRSKEIESLKKELDSSRRLFANLFYKNKKMRDLIERAKPYMLAYCRLVDCDLDDVHELIEEAELILK